MAKTKTNPEKKICAATLKLAASQGWSQLTLEQIAKTAKIPLVSVKKLFADKNDLLPALVQMIDTEVAASAGKPSKSSSQHDRLFDVMMVRFDILQTYRAAILGILGEVKRNPPLLRYLLPVQIQSMQKMLLLAGIKPANNQQLLSFGLLGLYAVVLYCWERDATADMSKTMAALDRHMRRAGKLAAILFPTS